MKLLAVDYYNEFEDGIVFPTQHFMILLNENNEEVNVRINLEIYNTLKLLLKKE